jgi:hypothetical protein
MTHSQIRLLTIRSRLQRRVRIDALPEHVGLEPRGCLRHLRYRVCARKGLSRSASDRAIASTLIGLRLASRRKLICRTNPAPAQDGLRRAAFSPTPLKNV